MKRVFLVLSLSLGFVVLLMQMYISDNTHTNAVFNIDHFRPQPIMAGFILLAAN